MAGTLRRASMEAAFERGPLYWELVGAESGNGKTEQLATGDFGSLELRGASAELTLVISIDKAKARKRKFDGQVSLDNSFTIQVRRSRVEGQDAAEWSREVFEKLVFVSHPAWAAAYDTAEYYAKVMSDGPAIEAIGYDFGKYLPGLFWLNAFGPPYRNLIGDDQLLSAPAPDARLFADTVSLSLADRPEQWFTPSYKVIERNVTEHIGSEYFFSKADQNRSHKAPAWATQVRG